MLLNFNFYFQLYNFTQFKKDFFQNSAISIEDFHSKLQETTSFPLRPFVIPFLKANLPLLQRELLYLSRSSASVNVHDFLNTTSEDPNPVNIDSFINSNRAYKSTHFSQNEKESPKFEIQSNKRKSEEETDKKDFSQEMEFIPPSKIRNTMNTSQSINSNQVYLPPTANLIHSNFQSPAIPSINNPNAAKPVSHYNMSSYASHPHLQFGSTGFSLPSGHSPASRASPGGSPQQPQFHMSSPMPPPSNTQMKSVDDSGRWREKEKQNEIEDYSDEQLGQDLNNLENVRFANRIYYIIINFILKISFT